MNGLATNGGAMNAIDGAEFLPPDALQAHVDAAWRLQSGHVEANSPFYRELWNGVTPPQDLRDLPSLPLSDKGGLRASQADHPPFGDYLAASRSEAVRLHRAKREELMAQEGYCAMYDGLRAAPKICPAEEKMLIELGLEDLVEAS